MGNTRAQTRLFLVRHGEVAHEWHERVYGDHDVPLSPRGEDEARVAARLLEGEDFAAVVSSGLTRAEYGAAVLRRGRDLQRRDEPELREVARGEWVGLRFDQVPRHAWEEWSRHPGSHRPPGGESLSDLACRVLPRLDALAREFAGERVAAVVHCWVIRVAVCEALGIPLDRAPRLAVGTGGISVLDWTAGDEDAPARGRAVVLAGFGVDRPPPRSSGWYRGPAQR